MDVDAKLKEWNAVNPGRVTVDVCLKKGRCRVEVTCHTSPPVTLLLVDMRTFKAAADIVDYAFVVMLEESEDVARNGKDA